MNTREARTDILWSDGKQIHACEGSRLVPSDPDTFVVWTNCGKDVPANQGFKANGEDVTCPRCLKKIATQSQTGEMR